MNYPLSKEAIPPGDLWLADRFRRDSLPLASTLFEQLFHHQLLPWQLRS